MKKMSSTLLALAFCCAGAQADDRTSALQASLAADGMTPISEGLYGRRDGGDEAYVAYTPAGQQALLQRLRELRAEDADSKRAAPNPLDRLIEQLGQNSLNADRYGDCNGPAASGPFRVQASASGGVSASASAQNTSNPTINTTNSAYASATNQNGDGPDQSTTTQGNAPATATASNNPRFACMSRASATVTCPGASSPAIVAFANSRANSSVPCRL